MRFFNLPDLGEGLAEAEVVEWHVKEGDVITLDNKLVSMETAKAIVEVPAPISGIIKSLCAKVGEVITTGAPLVEFVVADSVAGKLEVSSEIKPVNRDNRIKATPAVRALASKLQIDLALVTPTGQDNSITIADINNFQTKDLEFTPLTGVRKTMAQTITNSFNAVCPVTVWDDAILNNDISDITVALLQALVFAAKCEPALNAWFDGSKLARRLFTSVNIGIAVDSKEGLFVPVIQQVESLTAHALRVKIDEYKAQVLNRTLLIENMQNASIILSNFGKFAGKYATPVVIPPTVAILGVGRITNQVVPLSLTFDHRAATGGEATRFLGAIVEFLQQYKVV